MRNGRAEWVDVSTGLGTGSLVEVLGNLQAGDQIAIRGADEIRPDTTLSASAAFSTWSRLCQRDR